MPVGRLLGSYQVASPPHGRKGKMQLTHIRSLDEMRGEIYALVQIHIGRITTLQTGPQLQGLTDPAYKLGET